MRESKVFLLLEGGGGGGGRGMEPRPGRPLPVGRGSVSIVGPAETKVMVSPLCPCVATHKIVNCLETRPRDSLGADEKLKNYENEKLSSPKIKRHC